MSQKRRTVGTGVALKPLTRAKLLVLAQAGDRTLSFVSSRILERYFETPAVEKQIITAAYQQIKEEEAHAIRPRNTPAQIVVEAYEAAQGIQHDHPGPQQEQESLVAPAIATEPVSHAAQPVFDLGSMVPIDAALTPRAPAPSEQKVAPEGNPPAPDPAGPPEIAVDDGPPDLLPENKSLPRGVMSEAIREEKE